MPKKKPTPMSTPTKKPEVLALKRKPSTPEPEGKVINDASTTPSSLAPESSVGLKPEPTPEAQLEFPESQPLSDSQAPPPVAEVESAPTPTPGTKPTRPVLKKKTYGATGATTPDAPSTPGLVETPAENAIFQAVGIIVGDVTFNDAKGTVSIEGKDFPLFYAPIYKRAYEALQLEVTNTGVSRQRLIVYPRITHFPKREQPHLVSFQLVGFRREGAELPLNGITNDLGDFEFKLAGLWQFIPVCQTPCLSIFKNYTEQRKEFIKEADVALKVKFMKGSHVPVLWRDAPVRPFRFNPKLTKEQQGHAAFVQVKAMFDPQRDVFHVLTLTAPPASKAPRFFKAGKEDKLQVAQEKLKGSAPKGRGKK